MSRTGPIRDRRGTEAFTLIELLVVVSIIMVLLSTLVVATLSVRKKTQLNRTKGLIVTLKAGMASYYDVFRAYPPDGHDEDIVAYGAKIQGSQCLVWYLMRPLTRTQKRADGTKYKVGLDPMISPGDFPSNSLEWTVDAMLEREEVPHITDGFRSPLQYDRRESASKFTYLGDDGHEDPRGMTADDLGRNIGPYQIWSRGPDGRKESGNASDDVKSWEIQ